MTLSPYYHHLYTCFPADQKKKNGKRKKQQKSTGFGSLTFPLDFCIQREDMIGTGENNIDKQDRIVIKVIVLGSANVGKSAIMERYVESTFTGKRLPTLGTNFRTKILEIHDTSVVLQIWDTAGMERFHHGIQQLAQWRDEAVSKIDADVYFPIVGDYSTDILTLPMLIPVLPSASPHR